MLVDEVDGPVARREGGDLAAVLDELDLDALPDGGVGLLRLYAYLLEDDALGLGGTLEGISFLPEQPYFDFYLTPKKLLGYYGSLSGMERSGMNSRIDHLLSL